MKQKTLLIASNEEKKTWNYAKGTVNLNFTLRVDIKQQMKDWLEILDRAKADVEEELRK